MKRTLFFFVFFLPAIAASQFDLQFFIQSAYKNNPQINEFQKTFAQAGLERESISAENLLPKISLTADYLFAPYFNNTGKLVSTNPDANAVGYDVGITNGGLYSTQLNIEKNIFNGSVVDALSSQTMLQEHTAKNNIESAKHEIEKQVTDQYLQTFLSLSLLKLENENLGYLHEEQAVAEQLFEGGFLKQTDRLLLNIEIENSTIAVTNLSSQYRTNVNQLLTLCGIRDTADIAIDSVQLSLHTTVEDHHFEKRYELDSLASVNLQAISENKYLPQVTLFFNTGLNAVELSGIQRKVGFSAGVNFAYPLYDGGQRSISRQQNELSLQTISFYKENTRTVIENQKSIAKTRIDIQKKNLERLQVQIRNYSTVLTVSETEFKQGIISVVEYLTLLRNFIDLKKNLVSMQHDYQMEISNYNYWNW
jgi:outer membrane protein TolC